MTFRETLAAAVADIADRGYQSAEQIERWTRLLREAAWQELGPDVAVDAEIQAAFGAIFRREVEKDGVLRRVPGVGRYTLAMVKPKLRVELDRRILAAADLIKLNRRAAVEKTLQRFSGWSTSIPSGGGDEIDKRETRVAIGKSVAEEKFVRRRCAIDQGHKLSANVAEIVATDSGAIAAIWHDRGEHDKNYDARKEHLARSGHLFLVRDSWAIADGLVRRGSRPYTDEIDRPGQLVFCSCFYTYITSPRRLPDDCLTKAGHEWVSAGQQRAA